MGVRRSSFTHKTFGFVGTPYRHRNAHEARFYLPDNRRQAPEWACRRQKQNPL